jgi:hypothetical protein
LPDFADSGGTPDQFVTAKPDGGVDDGENDEGFPTAANRGS